MVGNHEENACDHEQRQNEIVNRHVALDTSKFDGFIAIPG